MLDWLGPAAIGLLLLTLLVVAHEFGHFTAARAVGVEVYEFAVGFPPRLLSRQLGATAFVLNAIPLGGYVRMRGEGGHDRSAGSFAIASPPRRVAILLAGPTANVLCGLALFFVSALLYAPVGTKITAVTTPSPAATAGLAAGDEIVSLAGNIDVTPDEVLPIARQHAGSVIELTFSRSGIERSTAIVPRLNPPPGQGPLGVNVNYVIGNATPAAALGLAVKHTLDSLTLLPRYTVDAFRGAGDLVVTGPIGILGSFDRAAGFGPGVVLGLAASISIQIALFNLLPWPVLDGGRILLVGYEVVRGRRIPPAIERALQATSMALLLILVLAVTASDISGLFGTVP